MVTRGPQFRLNNYQSDISHIRDGDCDSLHDMFVLFWFVLFWLILSWILCPATFESFFCHFCSVSFIV
jgi:hypothetical protein